MSRPMQRLLYYKTSQTFTMPLCLDTVMLTCDPTYSLG